MPANTNVPRLLAFVLAILFVWSPSVRSAQQVLWQIGKTDQRADEFALAPNGRNQFTEDGFFVVGRSDPRRDWPYVHPSLSDRWAGSRSHSFFIVFAIAHSVSEGTCDFILDLVDTHNTAPPRIRLTVNGESFGQALPAGGGAAISGKLDRAKPSRTVISFPAALLRKGTNVIEIAGMSGSWFIYDAVTLKTPPEITLAPLRDFTTIVSASPSPALVEKDGRPFLQITARVVHLGDPAEATVTLDGKPLGRCLLRPGSQTITELAPTVPHARPATLALSGKGGLLAKQNLRLIPGVREIIVVFKTHFDIGYTDMASNIVQRYRTTMIDQALAVADQSRTAPRREQFAWTIAGWPLHKILEDWPGQSPDRKQRVQDALKQGRFVVHALPFTTHTELLEPEDVVRGLGYSSQIARSLGLPLPRDAKMTDVPEHTWMLATVLKHAGVDFMMIGCNGSSGPLHVPPLYWWEGPNGSRVLTMYSVAYGTQLTPPADWPYKTWLACVHTGDNQGPPTPESVRALFERATDELPGVNVRIGRMSDFADAILAEKPDLPIVRADAPDTWIHGPMSDPAGARLARNLRPLIGATESLNTLLRLRSANIPDAAPAIAAAYEQSLLYGEHTWGGSIGWIGNRLSFGEQFKEDHAAGRFRRIEDSWTEHTAYIEKARDIITPVLDRNLDALASGVGVEGKRIVVFNPLPWKRSGLVTLEVNGVAPSALKPLDGYEILPVQNQGSRLAFVAPAVPAMGYRSFVTTPERPPASRVSSDPASASIESPFFRAVIDPARGVVRSLVDKTTGRELLDSAAGFGLGQYLYERFDGTQVTNYCRAYLKPARMHPDFYKPGLPAPSGQEWTGSASPEKFGLEFEKSPASVSAVLRAPASARLPAVTTRFTLYDDQSYADLEITLHDKPLEPWPEAGWLCLPFKIHHPQFHLGRLASIIDPAADIVPGANRHLFALQTGVTITDQKGSGVGLCLLDAPLVSLDTPGCWRFSAQFTPQKPVVYANLFNNQWNTNFRLWNQGTWTSRVRIWTVGHYRPEASLVTPSLEARYPLTAAMADGPGGSFPATGKGLELSRRGVLITSFGRNPDGPGCLLRLWEYSGIGGAVSVRLPEGMASTEAQPVTLRGQPIGSPIPVNHSELKIKLTPFGPASVVFN